MTTDDKPAPPVPAGTVTDVYLDGSVRVEVGPAMLDPEVCALLWHIAAEVLPGEYCDAEVAPRGIAEAANRILDRFKRLDAAGKAKL